MRKNKAQIALFIVAGLFILIAVGLGIYFVNNLLKDPWRNIPTEIKPLKAYAETCLKQSTEDAIFNAGVQGGYAVFPNIMQRDRRLLLDAGFKVPLWYYRGYDYVPTLEIIEQSLSQYIAKDIEYCIANFSSFSEVEITDKAGINVTVTLSPDRAVIETDLGMMAKMKYSEVSFKVPKIVIEQKTTLRKKFELAKAIMEKENSEYFLENLTYEMIAISDYLPTEGMEFSCKPEYWKQKDINSYIKDMVQFNLAYITFEGTSYMESGTPYYDKIYNIKLDDVKSQYKDIKVKINYNPTWPMSIDVNPKKNGMIKPIEMGNIPYVSSCFKLYHFKYDVDYPVLFTIDDPNDKNNPFFFATPVVVRYNEPDRQYTKTLLFSDYDQGASKLFCENSTSSYVTEQTPSGLKTSIKQITQLNIPTTVIAYDPSLPGYANTIGSVDIKYRCIKYQCDIGKTSFVLNGELGEAATMEGMFPLCLGGYILGEKEGYYFPPYQQDMLDETKDSAVNLPGYKVVKKNFMVKIRETTGYDSPKRRDLNANEHAYVTLTDNIMYNQILDYNQSSDDNYFEIPLGLQNVTVSVMVVEGDDPVSVGTFDWAYSSPAMENAAAVEFYAFRKNPGYAPQNDEDQLDRLKYSTDNIKTYPPWIY